MSPVLAMSPYGTYTATYRRLTRPIEASRAADPALQKLDVLFSHVRMLSGITGQQIKSQSLEYREQVQDFVSSRRGLDNDTDSLKTLFAKNRQKAADHKQQITTTVNQTVNDFNKMTKALGAAGTLPAKGKAMAASLRQAVADRAAELSAIGINYDQEVGTLTVDDKKLQSALDTNEAKVAGVLGGEDGFGADLAEAMRPARHRPAADFVGGPFAAFGGSYGTQLPGSAFSLSGNLYGMGLLLDISA